MYAIKPLPASIGQKSAQRPLRRLVLAALRAIRLRAAIERPALEIIAATFLLSPLRRNALYARCLERYTKPLRPPAALTMTHLRPSVCPVPLGKCPDSVPLPLPFH